MTNKTLKSKNNNTPEFNSHLKNYQIKSKITDDINGLRMHYLECGDKKSSYFTSAWISRTFIQLEKNNETSVKLRIFCFSSRLRVMDSQLDLIILSWMIHKNFQC